MSAELVKLFVGEGLEKGYLHDVIYDRPLSNPILVYFSEEFC